MIPAPGAPTLNLFLQQNDGESLLAAERRRFLIRLTSSCGSLSAYQKGGHWLSKGPDVRRCTLALARLLLLVIGISLVCFSSSFAFRSSASPRHLLFARLLLLVICILLVCFSSSLACFDTSMCATFLYTQVSARLNVTSQRRIATRFDASARQL